MKRKNKKLSPEQLDILQERFGPVSFSGPVDLVYEDQIPHSGVVLLEGEAVLTRKKKIIETVEPGTLMGVHQLINNEPVRHGCKLRHNARVILLHRSDLLELLDEDDSTLRKALIS